MVLRAYRAAVLVRVVAVIIAVLVSIMVEVVGSGRVAEWGMMVVEALERLKDL